MLLFQCTLFGLFYSNSCYGLFLPLEMTPVVDVVVVAVVIVDAAVG